VIIVVLLEERDLTSW
jgi:RNA-directed DNA polymerase